MDFRQIDRDLQKEYITKRILAEKIASANLARANSNSVYRKLDALERGLVLEYSKSSPKSDTAKNLKQNLETVRDEKKKILKAMKLSPADLKPKYSCLKCSDTGFVGGRTCECYKKRKNEELIKVFGLMTNSDCSFDNFETKICKNAKHAENLQKIAEILKKWSEKYPNNTKNNIIISGKTGVGKTFLSSCLANEFMKNDRSVCFVSAFDMNESFLKYHTSFDQTKSSWIEPFIHADILFIDDLGIEPMLKNVTKNYLYLIISERERFHKPIVITTNLMLDELNNRYDERICSRLCNKRNSSLIFIDGDDLRLSK